MNTAVKSTANVSILEEMVQERTHKLDEANRRVLLASANQLNFFAMMRLSSLL
jgi:hypothetical protein